MHTVFSDGNVVKQGVMELLEYTAELKSWKCAFEKDSVLENHTHFFHEVYVLRLEIRISMIKMNHA